MLFAARRPRVEKFEEKDQFKERRSIDDAIEEIDTQKVIKGQVHITVKGKGKERKRRSKRKKKRKLMKNS